MEKFFLEELQAFRPVLSCPDCIPVFFKHLTTGISYGFIVVYD